MLLPRTLVAAACLLAALPSIFAEETAPRIVNIVNFIRGVEPREPMDLVTPVVEQIKLAKKHGLPSTFLVQYDAMIKPEFADLLKKELGPEDEIGAWIEVVQPQVEAAGLKWRGRFPWDWHTDVGFTVGYTPEERLKLMDVYMEKFKEVFGKYPRSVGCWIIDAPTLNYLADKYGITVATICKDQSGTDGYTLWGGYWNQAFYPSRKNAFMPAQTAGEQLNVPVFRMLGSDPVTQYDTGIGHDRQGVYSLEPVYKDSGGDPKWVRWFFKTNFTEPSLAFAYAQAGQENSFGWPAMKDGLIDQYALLEEWQKAGKVRVETLEESGKWFRKKFDKTPATAIVAMDDAADSGKRSIWYESRFYRVNLFWDKDAWRVRDIHMFDENYAERYLTERVTTSDAFYDTLPVMDGYNWSTAENLAGIRLVDSAGKPIAGGEPKVTQGEDSLTIAVPLVDGGEMTIFCGPEGMKFSMSGEKAPNDWALQIGTSPEKKAGITGISSDAIRYRHNGFDYAVRCEEGTASQSDEKVLISPKGGMIALGLKAR